MRWNDRSGGLWIKKKERTRERERGKKGKSEGVNGRRKRNRDNCSDRTQNFRKKRKDVPLISFFVEFT